MKKIVEIFEGKFCTKNGKEADMVIFQADPIAPNSSDQLDSEVIQYAGEKAYVEFVPRRGNPWVRVLVFGLNDVI